MSPNRSLLVKRLLEQRRSVFGFIYALTRDMDAAEEIFQEVSVAILDEAAQDTAVEDFLPWVRELARRRTAEYYRHRSHQSTKETLAGSMLKAVDQAFEENEETREESSRRRRHLLECIEALPPTQREMIELRYRDQKSISRVAAILDWKIPAVKVALSKIKRILADCLHAKEAAREAL